MSNRDYVGTNHDMRNVNGSSVQMPAWFSGEVGWGNLVLPNPYVADTVQQYPIGTFFREGNRSWQYAQFRGRINVDEAGTLVSSAGEQGLGVGLLTRAYAYDHAAGLARGESGARTVVLGTSDTGTGNGTVAVDDFYSGGWLGTYESALAWGLHYEFHRIVKSTYVVAAEAVYSLTTSHTLTLDFNLVSPLAATAVAQVFPNRLKHLVDNTESAYQDYFFIPGAAMVGTPKVDQFLWIQSYGEIGTLQVQHGPGGSKQEMIAYWHSDGSISPSIDGATDTTKVIYAQRAGTIMPTPRITGTGVEEMYPMIFLETAK